MKRSSERVIGIFAEVVRASLGGFFALTLLTDCGPSTSPLDGSADVTADASTGPCHSDSECGIGGNCTSGACDTIVQVGAGEHHTCVLRSSGHVVCWGKSDFVGGLMSFPPRTLPPSVVGSSTTEMLGDVIEIAVGRNHSCGRQRSGRVYCWGDNHGGQSIPGSFTTAYATRATLVSASSGVDLIASTSPDTGKLAVGDSHTCVVMADGTVRCWGSNTDDELGTATATSYSDPNAVDAISDAVEVAAGGTHACARRAGTVTCWGANDLGQLGSGMSGFTPSTGTQVLTAAATPLNGAMQIAAGGKHTCARGNDGADYVRCWGENSNQELGSTNNTLVFADPAIMGIVGPIAEMRTGDSATCLRGTNGHVFCLGSDAGGGLGDGDATANHHFCDLSQSAQCTSVPVPVVGITTATAIAVGWLHACAIVGPRAVQCWGNNFDDELGFHDSVGDAPAPVTVPGL